MDTLRRNRNILCLSNLIQEEVVPDSEVVAHSWQYRAVAEDLGQRYKPSPLVRNMVVNIQMSVGHVIYVVKRGI